MTPGGKRNPRGLAVIGAVILIASLIVVAVWMNANPKVTVYGNPAKPTYTIPPVDPGMSGERLTLGPASIVLPPDWEYQEDSMEVDWDWEAGTATEMLTYFLVPKFNQELSCSLHVTPLDPPVTADAWAASLIQEAQVLQNRSEVSTDSHIGFAQWSGEMPMIYITNTRTYSSGIPVRYLVAETIDSTGAWSVSMLVSGDDREPHEVPCFDILRSLEVS